MRWFLATLFICLCILPVRAQEEQHSHTKAVLVLTLVMPRDAPDIRHLFKEDSLEECWKDAGEFVAHGVPKSVPDAVAIMAGCMVPKVQEEDM